MKLSQIASNITEAFKAGNKARKKESVADTVESTSDIYIQKKLFEKETGIKLELKNNRLYSKGLYFFNSEEVKLPDYLTVKGNLTLEFWKLTSLPKELYVMETLYLRECNNLTYLPADLEVGKDICFIPSSLKPFFKRLGIKIYGRFHGGDVSGKEWMEKRHLVTDEFLNKLNVWLIKHGYINEAFKAGNKARRKESAADAVESVPMDLKSAVYAWCVNMKAAIKKRNTDTSIPYKTDDFYLPEAIWSDLETDNMFESEENIFLISRNKNIRLGGSIAMEIDRIDDDTVNLAFYYEREDDEESGWLLFDGDGQNETNWIKMSAADLGSEKGVNVMTDVFDRCWALMFGDD